MDPGRRARYLEALGIDAWVPRTAPAPTAPLEQGAAVPGRGAASEIPAQSAVAAPVEPSSPRTPPVGAAPMRPQAPPAPVSGAAVAQEVAPDWEGLKSQVLACTRCELHRGRTQAVFASGARTARWMVVGEAPGADEDRQGEPFVGRAGQLLNAMLAAIGLPRPSVFVANMIKCRPPQNRDPRPEELAACRPYLERQLELLQPALVLVVGRIAAQNLLGTEAPLGRLRGQVHRVGGLNLPAIVTYHPAYLLRSPADKRKAWEDLKLARRVFGEQASSAAPPGG
jgi:DNA polymerase